MTPHPATRRRHLPTRPNHLLRPFALLAAVVLAATGLLVVRPAAAAVIDQTQVPVLSEDFSAGVLPDGWQPVDGTWQVVDGRLVGTSTGSQLSRVTFGPHLDNYRFEATVRFDTVENGGRWAALGLDLAADGAVPWWIATMRSQTTSANGIEFAERTAADSWNVPVTGPAPSAAGTGRDVRVAVEVEGNQARWYYDGQQVLETRSLRRSDDGGLGFVVNGARVAFDDVVVTELPEPTLVRADGAPPAVVAHRGYSSVAPENTLTAIEQGIRAGAEYVEIDAHTTSDGVPVLMHDQRVDRTTDGTGDVAVLSTEYLAGLDAGTWFAPTFLGEPVPTLAQALDAVRGSGSTLLLEVKGPETATQVEAMLALVRERDMVDQVLLQSFDTNVLTYARAADDDIALGLLRGGLDTDPVATARAYDVVAYNPSAGALAGRPEVVGALNEAGIAVMPYTVNAPAQWAALVGLGVDGIITDRPGALVGWNARLAQQRLEPDPAPGVVITSPEDGSSLGREQRPVVAVAADDADDVVLTLDGEPVRLGATMDLTGLALGEHVLSARASGPGGDVEVTSSFTVVPTEAGLAVLVLTAEPVRGEGNAAVAGLLSRLAAGDLEGMARRADQAAGRQLDEASMTMLAADARALAAG